MSKQRKIIASVVLGIIVAAVGYTLVPFRFADAVNCGPPLLGSTPGEYNNQTGLINPERDCQNAGRSRLTVAAVAALLAVVVGLAVAWSKDISSSCLKGRHGDCTEWWAAALGPAAAAYGCQCTCHGY